MLLCVNSDCTCYGLKSTQTYRIAVREQYGLLLKGVIKYHDYDAPWRVSIFSFKIIPMLGKWNIKSRKIVRHATISFSLYHPKNWACNKSTLIHDS